MLDLYKRVWYNNVYVASNKSIYMTIVRLRLIVVNIRLK